MKKTKHIAIVAFDSRKTDLIEWSYFNKKLLAPHRILALGAAENILEGTLNKKVDVSQSGKLGEYKELCNLITAEEIDGVIIFGEAEEILMHKDLDAVIEAAIKQNIIIASNRTTADFILHSSLIGTEYTVHKEEKKLTDGKQSETAAVYPLAKAS